MKIAIIVPMPEEQEYYLEKFEFDKQIQIGSVTFEHFKYRTHEIFLGLSGIGKVQAAMALTSLLAQQKIDLILVSGSAGSLSDKAQVGDLVVASELAYHDVEATRAGNYVVGQLPSEPARFDLTNDYRTKFITHLEETNTAYHNGLIVTGDAFVADSKTRAIIKENFPDALGTEMEGAAFAQVAAHFATPLIVLRSISDNGDENADFDFDQFVKKAGRNAASSIISFLETDIF